MVDKSNLYTLSVKARNDDKARKKLIAEINKLVKETNKRLRDLEKAGIETHASKVAQYRLDILRPPRVNANTGVMRKYTRFKTITKKDVLSNRELRNLAMYTANFINSKTSTIEGYEESNEKRIATYEAKYGKRVKNKEAFNEYLKSAGFARLVEMDSNQALQTGIDNVENLEDVAYIDELFKSYDRGEIKYQQDLIEEWVAYGENKNEVPFD